MKNKILIYTLIFILTNIFSSCAKQNDTSNRVYFTIDPEDRKMVLPVALNDSISVNLTFDSGGGAALHRPVLDISILASHPHLFAGAIPDTTKLGSNWGSAQGLTLIYDVKNSLKIGTTSIEYSGALIMDWKNYMHNDIDGGFNIPYNDSIHIWELNFEHNYMEIHTADNFEMPENTYILPFADVSQYHSNPFHVQMPLQIKFTENDTLTINQAFFIDTGMPDDIAIKYLAEELDFFNQKDGAVWTKFMKNYHRYYTVNATLFDNLKIDSLRIYTYDYRDNVTAKYLIGLNFLKRFNVFFDMKNKQLGLQPIKNFQRVVNPTHRRFHYSTRKTPKGKYIVNKVADYKGNYYKEAGLQEGDEIVKLNDIHYGDISYELEEEFRKRDIVVLDIIRQGKPMRITAKINHNEKQGN